MAGRLPFSALVLNLMLVSAAAAQQPAAPSNADDEKAHKERIDAALKLTTEAAKNYELRTVAGDPQEAELRSEPVLRWSNPNVGEIHGNVFLWTLRERPIAVGSLFKWFSPHTHTSHEFQSLCDEPLTAAYAGRDVWTTKEPGVKFTPIPKAQPPAESATRRLAQMRQLAAKFTGHMTSREGQEYELRLLTQPIYRYQSKQDGVLDGGLFAFVLGTDPEILLLVEARGETDPRWQFAAARMQNCAVSVKYDGDSAWSAEQLEWSVAFDHSQPYTLFDTPGK